MRLLQAPPALLTLLLTTLASASPYPRDDLRDLGFGYLQPRQCAQYCGADNEHCCAADESCHTSSGIAACTAVDPILAARDYTSTWTVTYTSTISSWTGPTTTAVPNASGENCIPEAGTGQIACGSICCANWQYCAAEGQCAANAGVGTWTEVVTTGVLTTVQFSAPNRPTGTVSNTGTATGTAETATSTGTSTATPTPVGSTAGASTGASLSGGAIAGIVVGTIAGIILLLLLCFCCIARGLWGAFAAIFGGGRKRKTERVEITEERYSRHGSAHAAAAARPSHRTWFGGGGGGGRPSTAASRKEKKSGGGLGWLAAGAGAAALLLGLKRHEKHTASRPSGSHRPPRSDWSSSYYTDSYTASSPI
ncbi:Uu.00g014510.m01.CDS01 [Anthostomella pinea]|uniref:Uu.00g014510.m01.CDS01 n=1 Tax=Anthostomella pinea TaxID=933095 RepID=A0AAI8VYD9_9PEZI|nr:Uu.00g014510.m01.CDS01 [Anthostomella pinea]